MQALILSIIVNAFKKDNFTKSPSTAIAMGSAVGAAGLYTTYSTQEELISAVCLGALSVIMFFVNERKNKD